MIFVNDAAMSELAKSSTILQCIVHQLDFECSKFHIQAELIEVSNGVAFINCDPMTQAQIIGACMTVNNRFKRKDKKLSCKLQELTDSFVTCEAGLLSDYSQLA